MKYSIKNSFPILDAKQNEGLLKNISNREVKNAMFSIGGSKVSREEGFLATFYQQNWHIVGESVCKFARDVFNRRSQEDVNKALLCLISKNEKLEFIN